MKKNIKQFDSQILEMYEKGYSSSAIAEFFNVSKPGVISRLRKYNAIQKRRKNMIVAGYSLKSYDSEIIDLYNKGYSIGHIGKILNLKRSSIYNRLLVNNVQLRSIKGIKHSFRTPTITLNYFKNKVVLEKNNFDYFLGLLASDGNVCRNIIRIGGIADENVEFLQHWCNFLDNKLSIKRRLRANKHSYYNEVSFKNQDIVDFLSTYGIVPNKTFSVELPYINWNVIRGIFDGDGCLVKDKRCLSWKFEIVTGSIKLANQLYDFYIKENLKAHIYKENNLYKVNILNRKDIKYVFKHLYQNCPYFLKRKYEKFLPVIEETQ